MRDRKGKKTHDDVLSGERERDGLGGVVFLDSLGRGHLLADLDLRLLEERRGGGVGGLGCAGNDGSHVSWW